MSTSNGKVIGVLIGGIALGAVIGAAATMKLGKTSTLGGKMGGDATCSIDGAGSSNSELFELDGKKFGAEAFPADVRDTLFQIQSQSYETTSNFARELALRYALAAEQKLDVAQNLPPLRALVKVPDVTEEEMKSFYDANKKSIPPNTTYAQIKPQLQQYLISQKVGDVSREKVTEFMNSGRIKILVSAPVAPVVNLPLEKFPSQGPNEASVVVVESSDYLCPHCRNVQQEVKSALKEHAGKVRFVQANFALRPQQLSGALVRGGICAFAQGNEAFWKYHEAAFQIPLEAANPVTPDAQKEFDGHAIKIAKDVGLDEAAFSACLASEETRKTLEANNNLLSGAGVSGTPTFFINNRKISLGGKSFAQALAEAVNGGGANDNPNSTSKSAN